VGAAWDGPHSVAQAIKAREQSAAQVWDREMLLAKKQTQVEAAANAYHALAARMHILPTAGEAPARDVSLLLAVDLQAPQAVLASLKSSVRVRRHPKHTSPTRMHARVCEQSC
jgi:hypothetical protein